MCDIQEGSLLKQDYSEVTSLNKALKLVKKGKLFPILLLPAEFGGEDVAVNRTYVPAGIPEVKDQITGTLIQFAAEGLIDRLRVKVKYKGKSVVPSKIKMVCTHTEKEGRIEPEIEIW